MSKFTNLRGGGGSVKLPWGWGRQNRWEEKIKRKAFMQREETTMSALCREELLGQPLSTEVAVLSQGGDKVMVPPSLSHK